MLRKQHFRMAETLLHRGKREKIQLDRAQGILLNSRNDEDELIHAQMLYDHVLNAMLHYERQAEVHALLANCRIKDGDLGNADTTETDANDEDN
jgi:hypothetical protein